MSYLLAEHELFSRSLLWQIQSHYFGSRGAEAWRLGEVPHYVTSNPSIANAYAELVFAFWQDQQSRSPCDEPLYLCELGAGSGRFAFHFLKRLLRLCERQAVAPASFRYVLTDFAQSNLEAWRLHPSFQPFFATHLLDMALFDVNAPGELVLQISGEQLGPERLRFPLVVIANYLFDSVPQDLYYFKAGVAHDCLVSLATEEDSAQLDVAELLEQLQLRYDYRMSGELGEEAALIAFYREALEEAHVLVPSAGLRALRHLWAISPRGLFVLSADKGAHHLEKVAMRSPPDLVRHGSFSLNVNYHAFKHFCEQSGGVALLPRRENDGIEVVALLMVEGAAAHGETRCAWARCMEEFTPGEYLTVSQHARAHIPEMKLSSMLAYVRLGFCDSHIFGHYLPRLRQLAPQFDAEERRRVAELIDDVWENYFPLGEDRDLSYGMGCLLYEMDEYRRALIYFERSLEIYGAHTGTYYNMAACHYLLDEPAQAESLARKVVAHDPENGGARELLAQIEGAGRG